jgi:hypothetical protein
MKKKNTMPSSAYNCILREHLSVPFFRLPIETSGVRFSLGPPEMLNGNSQRRNTRESRENRASCGPKICRMCCHSHKRGVGTRGSGRISACRYRTTPFSYFRCISSMLSLSDVEHFPPFKSHEFVKKTMKWPVSKQSTCTMSLLLSFHVALSKSTNRDAQRELEQHSLAEHLKRSKASNIEGSYKVL